MAARRKRTGASDARAASRGLDRARHFAEGGDPATWRGRPVTFTDRRRQASKDACEKRNWDR